MVVIRLTRVGKKKQAHYRIVVAESKRAVQGKFISILGWYNPHTKELQINKEDLKSWLDKGAQPSNTVAKLLKSQKIELPKWVKIVERKRAPKKKEAEAPTSGGAGVPTDSVGKAKADEGAEAEAPTPDVAEAAEETTEAPAEEVTKDVEPEEAKEENSEAPSDEAEEPKEEKSE